MSDRLANAVSDEAILLWLGSREALHENVTSIPGIDFLRLGQLIVELGVSRLAREASMSEASVRRRLAGFGGARWLAVNYRVHSAINLLRMETGTLVEVARRAGFGSASSFCRSFKKVTGQSPRNFLPQADVPRPRELA